MPEERIGHYIHGTEPEEQRRLFLLNDLMNEGSLRALGLSSGDSVLDLGSGLGQLSRQMARAIGAAGRVVGIERDPVQLEEARRLARENGEEHLVDLRLGDAFDLPLEGDEWGGFDVAHTRFLLEHVPRPQRVVDAMVRAVRPGGRVVLEDDDHDLLRVWPEVEGFDRLWRAYLTTYDELGNDPYVGRRLVSMLEAAGAQPVRNDMLFFGSCAGQDAFEAFVGNFVGLLEGAADTIVESAALEREKLEEGDLLLFCSDGFEDCANGDSEPFGDRRLSEVLAGAGGEPAQQVADGLIAASNAFATDIGDDRTLVVIRAIEKPV